MLRQHLAYISECLANTMSISERLDNIGVHCMLSIYKFGLSVCLFVCLFVCLYPINVKTAEPIGPKFFVGHHVIPGKVYGWKNFQKFASIKIRFLKILKIHEFFFENPRNFFVCYLFTRRTQLCILFRITFFTNKIKDGREAL